MTLLSRPLPAVAPRRPPQELANATLVEWHAVGPTAALVTLELDTPLDGYCAGQYVALGVRRPDGWLRRPYSVVSLTRGGRWLELFVRRVAGGALSPLLWQLEPGDRLHAGQPRGLFGLDSGSGRGRLFVGAGTGVAPLLAMLAACAARRDRMPATLIHGAAYAHELVFDDRFERWRSSGLDLRYLPTISRPADPTNEGWGGLVGRAETIIERLTAVATIDVSDTIAYVCGSPPMVANASAALAAIGFTREQIRCERF
jgi:ferredoxin--NADP+ reductase